MKKSKIMCFVFILVVSSFTFSNSFDGVAFSSTYDRVMEQGKKEMYSAIEILDIELNKNPNEPQALMYKGSLIAKIADLDFFFWDKLRHVNEGISLMTQAMDILDGEAGTSISEKDKIRMYIIHGITCALIPATFKQTPVALYELERAVDHAYFSEVNISYQAQSLGLISKMYRRVGKEDKAQEALDRGILIDAEITRKFSK